MLCSVSGITGLLINGFKQIPHRKRIGFILFNFYFFEPANGFEKEFNLYVSLLVLPTINMTRYHTIIFTLISRKYCWNLMECPNDFLFVDWFFSEPPNGFRKRNEYGYLWHLVFHLRRYRARYPAIIFLSKKQKNILSLFGGISELIHYFSARNATICETRCFTACDIDHWNGTIPHNDFHPKR